MKLAWWCAVLLGACAPGYEVSFDRSTLPDGMDSAGVGLALDLASAFWTEHGHDIERMPDGDDDQGVIAVRFVAQLPGVELGLYNADGVIQIDNAITDPALGSGLVWVLPGEMCPPGKGVYLEAVLRHELGHAMGLPHSPDPASIMWAALGTCSLPSKP